MASTPPTVSPCEGVIGFRSSVQVVVLSMAGGLPKKHWKQVLAISSVNTSRVLAVMLIKSPQLSGCEWAERGGN